MSPRPVNKGRAAKVAKWAVLLAAVPVLLAILIPRDTGNASGVKPVSARRAAPDFTLRDLSGDAWELSAHRGSVVLVNFWATWCSPCREETPGLVRIARAYAGKDVAVAGISMDQGGADSVRAFMREYGVDYPVMMPSSGFLLANDVEGLPTTLLIDREGRVARTYLGAVRETVFRADINRLLGEPAG